MRNQYLPQIRTTLSGALWNETGRIPRSAVAVAAIATLTSVAALPSAPDAQAQTAKQRSVKLKGILKKPGQTRRTNANRGVRFDLKTRGRGPGCGASRRHRATGGRGISRRAGSAKPLRGILKKPSPGRRVKLGGGKKKVRFNTNTRRPGPGYRDRRVRSKSRSRRATKSLMNRQGNAARNARKARNARSVRRGGNTAKNAARARRIRNTAKAAKLAKGAKYLAAGTGVVAVVGLAAGAAGLDPVEMATLKATNPAEYQRRMRALKKNPLKYMGNNVKNNTAKVGRGIGKGARAVGRGTKKVGQGIGRGARKVGQGFKRGGKKFGKGVKKVFAKRKKRN